MIQNNGVIFKPIGYKGTGIKPIGYKEYDKTEEQKILDKLYKYQLKQSNIEDLVYKTLPIEHEFEKIFFTQSDDGENILTSKIF